MKPIQTINAGNEDLMIHPLRSIDMQRIDEIQADVFEILSDVENTQYISEKRLKTKNEASDLIFGFVLGYQNGLRYAHFITAKKLNKVIGVIDIISPDLARRFYKLDKYEWMIEYYLHKAYWNIGIMSNSVGLICQELKAQGIHKIAAVCNKQNIYSIKVLNNIGFIKKKPFDQNQDYYEY